MQALRTSLFIEAHPPQSLDPATASGPNQDDPASPPILDFVASDETLDRFGEVISASGWRLETYRRNPVFQNAHQYGDILFTLGRALITEVRPSPSAAAGVSPRPVLFQRIQFATDVNPIARVAYGLYKAKFLNAVSVGFIPLRWEDAGSPPEAGGAGASPASGWRRRYLEQELLEVSAVGIPANPNALALGLKSGAVSRSDLKDALELLRSVTAVRGHRAPPDSPAGLSHFPSRQSVTPAPYHPGLLLALARELHRILRRA